MSQRELDRHLDNVAIHEAGHAVVAEALGVPYSHAAVATEEGRGGYILLMKNHDPVVRDRLENFVAVALAGERATRKAGMHRDGEGADDRKHIAEMIRLHVHEDSEPAAVDRMILRCFDRADEVLEEHWDAVAELAVVLRRDELASRDEVRAIVEKHANPARRVHFFI